MKKNLNNIIILQNLEKQKKGITLNIKKKLNLSDEQLITDTRIFWISALLKYSLIKNKKIKELLNLTKLSADRKYPGFVCEKLYYTCSSKKLLKFTSEIIDLASKSVKLGYKPESVLYWLRVVSDNKKIKKNMVLHLINLGKIAQKHQIKPEHVYYELWGLANYNNIKSNHILFLCKIIGSCMQNEHDPYDILHWLRININKQSSKEINNIFRKIIKQTNDKIDPIKFLVQRAQKKIFLNANNIYKIADEVVEVHTF